MLDVVETRAVERSVGFASQRAEVMRKKQVAARHLTAIELLGLEARALFDAVQAAKRESGQEPLESRARRYAVILRGRLVLEAAAPDTAGLSMDELERAFRQLREADEAPRALRGSQRVRAVHRRRVRRCRRLRNLAKTK